LKIYHRRSLWTNQNGKKEDYQNNDIEQIRKIKKNSSHVSNENDICQDLDQDDIEINTSNAAQRRKGYRHKAPGTIDRI
jgi:hypothetical protein